jgi:hypothetical protein
MNVIASNLVLCALLLLAGCGRKSTAPAVSANPNTDWLRDAQYGVLIHFLPADPNGLALVKQFDVEALAAQLESLGAKYLVFTLGQHAGYYNAPNAKYDKCTGYAPGERCSTRDLPLELQAALKPKGIRLMLYLPCQTPTGDPRAQKAFGLQEGKQEQQLSIKFAQKWAEVIQEWSDRYGEKVAGWWFDGCSPYFAFDEMMAGVYADAARHGNPRAIVSFNGGGGPSHATEAEDFTAGEMDNPFAAVPSSRWLEGSQWHVLTYIGSYWAKRDTRFPTEKWIKWAGEVAAKEGAFTLDMGPNYDPSQGPIGSLSEAQMTQVKAIKASLEQRQVQRTSGK